MPDAIIETVTTTTNPDGSVNCAAMGVEWSSERIVIRPFRQTRTRRNFEDTPFGVVHLTDDVLLFAQAALGDPRPPTRPASAVPGAVISDACSWAEVAVERIVDEGERFRLETRVVERGRGREHLGLNRARHAVVEASIVASRLRFIAHDEVDAELARLLVLVDKTAGERERAAWDYVQGHVARRRRRG